MKQLELLPHKRPKPEPVNMSLEQAKKIWKSINGLKQKDKPKTLTGKCSRAINTGKICFGEAIDWLVERGIKEKDAFEWAMDRFYGGTQAVPNGSSSGLKEAKLTKHRSRLRKAA
jgi:hypothetical protein